MYLHEPGDDADSISKEELASGYVFTLPINYNCEYFPSYLNNYCFRKHKMRDSMSSEFGPRSHAFENRSFSSADNSPISSPSIHHSHKPFSTIESVVNTPYKTPTARYEQYKQSYFDDHHAAEPSRPALPLTASWAKSASGSSTPTFRHQHNDNQDLDVTSDNFGPSLAAAVALAQKANNHSHRSKSDRKEAKKTEQSVGQLAGMPSGVHSLRQEANVETDADYTGIDDGTSESGSTPKIVDPLTYFVLGMDATDICVPGTAAESEITILAVSSLHEEASVSVPERKQDVQEEQAVVTGVAFLKSNIRYNTANLQTTFDPWEHQPITQSASSNQDSLARELTKGAIQRPQWREQATLHGGVDNGSPSASTATAYIQGSNMSGKQTLPDMSLRSAALLSALQSNAEQQASRSEPLNTPPGISRQYRTIPSEIPTTQTRVLSPPSTISPLAVLNGVNVPSISPRFHNAPSNLPFSPDMHDGKLEFVDLMQFVIFKLYLPLLYFNSFPSIFTVT
jgi:hypothetical protein